MARRGESWGWGGEEASLKAGLAVPKGHKVIHLK